MTTMTNTLFEALGADTWVALRKHIGAPVDSSTEKALADTHAESHRFRDCVRMLNCPEHRSKWRTFSTGYRAEHRKSHPLPKKVRV